MYRFEIDEKSKTLTAELQGIFCNTEVDQYNLALTRNVDELLRRFGRIKYVADARQSAVQPAKIAATIYGPAETLRTPQDRLAIVVASSLAKMQASRLSADPRASVFDSMSEARIWLDAND